MPEGTTLLNTEGYTVGARLGVPDGDTVGRRAVGALESDSVGVTEGVIEGTSVGEELKRKLPRTDNVSGGKSHVK